MVTVDDLDKFVRSDDGFVRTLHIEFDEYAVGRLSVCADTWTRILCHVEDRPNVCKFSVPFSDNPFDFDHGDYLFEKYCRLSNPAWVADLQALADQINDAVPGCSVSAIYRIM